jgi:hypothetical protein
MEPHPTPGASDTGLRPGSEATQIVLYKVLGPSGSVDQACSGGESRFQLHDLGLCTIRGGDSMVAAGPVVRVAGLVPSVVN